MLRVSAEALLSFAQRLIGQELHTLHRPRPFRVAQVAAEDGAVIFVTSKGKHQQASGKWLRETCETFSRTNSYRPSDYTHTHGVCYTLALIRRFADSQPAKRLSHTAEKETS